MRIRRLMLAGTLMATTLAVPGAARADLIFYGSCTIDIRLDFSGAIRSNSAPRDVDFIRGRGDCTTTASLPFTAENAIVIDGDGDGNTTTCNSMDLEGFFGVSFSPEPAPPSSAGQWTYNGTIQDGVFIFDGSDPTFVGIAMMSANGASAACQGAGVSVVDYSGSLFFIDP